MAISLPFNSLLSIVKAALKVGTSGRSLKTLIRAQGYTFSDATFGEAFRAVRSSLDYRPSLGALSQTQVVPKRLVIGRQHAGITRFRHNVELEFLDPTTGDPFTIIRPINEDRRLSKREILEEIENTLSVWRDTKEDENITLENFRGFSLIDVYENLKTPRR